jgi:uncharacterized protein (TIGR03435 family)
MKDMNRALFAILGAAAAFAQTPVTQTQPRPEFDVATVRPSAPMQEGVVAGLRLDGAQVRWGSLTLKDYIGAAYRIKLYQISGPDWLGSDRFDIAGTMPAGIPMTQMPEMMQSLLEERFKVKVHREKKDFAVYTLEVAKGGLKMQESGPDPDAANADPKTPLNITGGGSAQGISINLGRGSSMSFANGKMEAKRVSMQAFAGTLERFVDRPIVDMTNLKGTYDVTLDVTPEDYRSMLIRAGVNAGAALPPEVLRFLDGATVPSLFDALQKLGLKMEARKAPLDLLVVDEARKTPTEN